MANSDHLKILKAGLDDWRSWRKANPTIQPDLSGANLQGADLYRYNFDSADLEETNLSEARLLLANFRNAYAPKIDFSRADLRRSYLDGAYFDKANMNGANLSGADLERATLVDANLQGAILSGCFVYGVSAWGVKLEGAVQSNLVITRWEHRNDGSKIQVDSLEVAQFVHLLLNNQKIRHVIDTITSKLVLILGRFTAERKAILDAIRDELRKRDYLPVLFDFEKPSSRDITETVSTLAHMARFVIADITDARSIPQELMAIVPTLPSVPVQPLLLASQREYGMFEHFRRYPWVLPVFEYRDQEHAISSLDLHVIGPAQTKAKEQTGR